MAQQLGRALLAGVGRHWAAQQQQAAGLASLQPWVQAAGFASKPTALIKELREKSGAPISDVKVPHSGAARRETGTGARNHAFVLDWGTALALAAHQRRKQLPPLPSMSMSLSALRPCAHQAAA